MALILFALAVFIIVPLIVFTYGILCSIARGISRLFGRKPKTPVKHVPMYNPAPRKDYGYIYDTAWSPYNSQLPDLLEAEAAGWDVERGGYRDDPETYRRGY